MDKVLEINASTGEVIEREKTQAELDQAKLDAIEKANIDAAKAQHQVDKAALLSKLGITADEAKLLLS